MKSYEFRPRCDYEYKSYILREHKDLLKYVKKCSRFDYVNYQLQNNGLVLKMPNSGKKLMTVNDLRNYCFENGLLHEFLECQKINHASYKRTTRLKDRINSILSRFESSFLTLTFSDKALQETTPKTRRVMVSRFLRSFGVPYVANIDFGVDKTKTMREHYHAVIGCQQVDYSKWPYMINGERINIKNEKALAKYISKLSNHAIKEQAKRSSLLYSRDA